MEGQRQILQLPYQDALGSRIRLGKRLRPAEPHGECTTNVRPGWGLACPCAPPGDVVAAPGQPSSATAPPPPGVQQGWGWESGEGQTGPGVGHRGLRTHLRRQQEAGDHRHRASPPSGWALLSTQISLTKHRFKDTAIENFQTRVLSIKSQVQVLWGCPGCTRW